MYRFLSIKPDGTSYSLTVPGYDLVDAFRRYRRGWWTPDAGDVAVYHKYELVAWVLPAIDIETGESVPMLKRWK
jgi:hypothetical protein